MTKMVQAGLPTVANPCDTVKPGFLEYSPSFCQSREIVVRVRLSLNTPGRPLNEATLSFGYGRVAYGKSEE